VGVVTRVAVRDDELFGLNKGVEILDEMRFLVGVFEFSLWSLSVFVILSMELVWLDSALPSFEPAEFRIAII
jgi:hypothetical protein